jgi:asparagine synthase (glutamine-hydrolysing)
MCGIVGVLRSDGLRVERDLVESMAGLVAHRGPDGAGAWTNNQIGLGHRRLAIIDTSDAAAQPMKSYDDRFVLTYNGEIYNFRELRRELSDRGEQFRTNSDTEVVLHALVRWGPEAVRRFKSHPKSELRVFLVDSTM